MSKADETRVSSLLSQALGITFENSTYKLDDWGAVDNWAELGDGEFLFLEVESGQKHPDTNVAKLWPYLEKHGRERIFLIQAFFASSHNLESNRGRLGEWVAKKLEAVFPGRFRYCKLVIQDQMKPESFSCLSDEVKVFVANKGCSNTNIV